MQKKIVRLEKRVTFNTYSIPSLVFNLILDSNKINIK